ncbi:hypothetical protein A1O3_07835 [Capronia epimyces CBS 606.96]|uniref:BZIP domain-containing protein n=1 Tax=Capronia epimyces CBS 606.96 TaxID=1182542 RepID=W9XRE0_9EURO|nr:uncharacterized protein A1O3_07835 [Capronia epimyces CBS 606.96]EXJ79556.1 hypothetical protein A1O3_07835 [Capronia epimyces CBS 606.96]
MPNNKNQSQETRKAKAPDLKVPQPGEDAAERKRMLNILAQRRYRQRRKQHVQRLEARVNADHDGDGDGDGGGAINRPTPQNPSPSMSTSTSMSPSILAIAADRRRHLKYNAEPEPKPTPPAGLEFRDLLPFQVQSGKVARDWTPNGDQASVAQQEEHDHCAIFNENMFDFPIDEDEQCLWDNDLSWSGPSLASPSTPLSETTRVSSIQDTSTSSPLACVPAGERLTTANPATTTKMAFVTQDQDQNQNQNQNMQYSFADDALLEMTELKLLHGCMSIARRMNLQHLIWSLTSLSPFTLTFSSSSSSSFTSTEPDTAQFTHLPPNLQPTLVQLSTPHHPIIDLLPWPAVRDRLIMVLSQPPEARPAGAASPTALLDLVYDLEDSAEGVRIFGDDPFSAQSWEVGETVFRAWWWMFDRDVVRRSNELRALRGAPMLGSGTGTVLGEVR